VQSKTPSAETKTGEKTVISARFHPRDSRVFFATQDGLVGSWDGKNKSKPDEIYKHEGSVALIALSPNGNYLASASSDGTAIVWDVQGKKAKLVKTIKHEGPVHQVAFSYDNKFVASSSADHTVRVANLETNDPVFIHSGHAQGVLPVAFNPKHGFLATASQDGIGRIFRMYSETPFVLRGHDAAVRSIAWNHAGDMLVTGAGDGTDHSPDETARLWNPGNLERISYGPQREASFHSVDGNPRSMSLAAVHGDATVRVFARESGNKPLAVIPNPNSWVASASLSADSQSVVTASFY